MIFLTVFVDLLGFGMVIPLLPLYADQYAVDPSGWVIGLLMACFSVMQFIFAPIWGMLSDRIGRRPVLMIGLSASVFFYALFGLAALQHSLLMLFITRIGAGIAGATIPTAQAYIADTTTPENRTRGMALIGMAVGMGFTFGPLFGYLAVPSGHGDPGPWPGFAASGLSAIALGLAYFLLPESRRPGGQSTARKWIDHEGLRIAMSRWSILLLLVAYFVCVFAFVKLEVTLSILIKGPKGLEDAPFQFTFRQVCLTYAFIGFNLALVQACVIRPLSRRVADPALAITGAVIEVFGFALVVWAVQQVSVTGLLLGLGIIVTGFAFLQPSLNALISRWTDRNQQGAVLGFAQSLNAMARIVGSAIGIPMLMFSMVLPYVESGLLIGCSGVIIWLAILRRKREESR